MTEAAIKDLIAGLAWGPTPSGCWLWDGPANRRGQPVVSVKGEYTLVHRVAYNLWRERFHQLHGPLGWNVPLVACCGNRLCVNPFHVEPFDPRVSLDPRGAFNRGKRNCPRGHPYSGSNVQVRSSGRRRCRACHAEELRRLRARRLEAKRAEAELAERLRSAREAVSAEVERLREEQEPFPDFWLVAPDVYPPIPEPVEYCIIRVGVRTRRLSPRTASDRIWRSGPD